MDWLTRWDIILLGAVAYIAVMTLVRLMLRRRDRLVAEVQQQLKAHRKRAKQTETPSTDPHAPSP